MKAKKVLTLVMAASLVAGSLAGCGDKQTDNGKSPNNNETVVNESYFNADWLAEREAYEKEHPPYDVPEHLKGTTVKFATWIDHTTTEAANAIATFEEATGIKVEWVEIPQADYLTKVASAINAGEAPDIFVENMDTFPSSLNLLQPLNKIETMDLEDPIWDQGMSDFSTFGGNTYLVNTKYSIWNGGDSVFYNKKVLEDNGILTPQDYIDAGQWTTDNMLKIMSDFKALNSGYTGGQIEPRYLAASAGVALVQMKDGKFVSSVDDPTLTNMYNIYYNAKSANLIGGSVKTIMNGTSALYITGNYGLKKSGYFKGIDPDVLGVAPIPSQEGGETSNISAIYRSYGICRGAQNPEGAAYFLRYFLDPLNYDYDETFINEEARDYYINTMSGIDSSKKVFDFSSAAAVLYGYSGSEKTKWQNALLNTNADQFNTTLQSMSNEIAAGVQKANEIIESVIERDK